MTNELKKAETAGVAEVEPADKFSQLLGLVSSGKIEVASLEKLVDLQLKIMGKESAREFDVALSAFQAEIPEIIKSSTAKVVTKAGGEFTFGYATDHEIAKAVRPTLSKHGLSFKWDSEIDKNNWMTVYCHVKHIGGHGETSQFKAPIEFSNFMSKPQSVASVLTFGRRNSLIQALGITMGEEDFLEKQQRPAKVITAHQVADLKILIEEAGVDLNIFLKRARVTSVSDMPAHKLRQACQYLERKLEAKERAHTK